MADGDRGRVAGDFAQASDEAPLLLAGSAALVPPRRDPGAIRSLGPR